MTLDDLKSINNFDKYEKFIRTFFLMNQDLWRLVFYPYSDPFDDPRAVEPEDPYTIFARELDGQGKNLDSHGVVLFQDKDDTIQNSSNVTILISFESTRMGNSYFLDNNYIIFQIICKGSDIRKLANDKDRVEAIEELIDNEFNFARINNISDIRKISCKKLNLNEQNIGRVLMYKCIGAGNNLSDNKNYQLRKYGKIL